MNCLFMKEFLRWIKRYPQITNNDNSRELSTRTLDRLPYDYEANNDLVRSWSARQIIVHTIYVDTISDFTSFPFKGACFLWRKAYKRTFSKTATSGNLIKNVIAQTRTPLNHGISLQSRLQKALAPCLTRNILNSTIQTRWGRREIKKILGCERNTRRRGLPTSVAKQLTSRAFCFPCAVIHIL